MKGLYRFPSETNVFLQSLRNNFPVEYFFLFCKKQEQISRYYNRPSVSSQRYESNDFLGVIFNHFINYPTPVNLNYG